VLTDGESSADLVVLLDEHGEPQGTAPRSEVHTDRTPLHLAFSCYLFDRRGRLLLTRRASTKRTWPGVWTNSFCGHPRPGEEVPAAVHRYAAHELGVELTELTSLLPSFRYLATDPAGTVENELCPVFAAITESELSPDPDEVAEHRWLELEELHAAVSAAPWALSPWLVEQVGEISSTGGWPFHPADLAPR
jgi:isopentenyl-diphosphate delta-isomerase